MHADSRLGSPEENAVPPRLRDQHAPDASEDPGGFGDMPQEIRILLQGAQTLTAFLTIIPFSAGFGKINQVERWVYVATFLCALSSLVVLSAPAVQHRLDRPLRNRVQFKLFATRTSLVGVVARSPALVLATLLVASELLGSAAGRGLSAVVAGFIGVAWWIVPNRDKARARRERPRRVPDADRQQTKRAPGT